MMKLLFAALIATSACTTEDQQPIEIENSHGKADGTQGVTLVLDAGNPGALLRFVCAEWWGNCDIELGLTQIQPELGSVAEQLRASDQPDAQRAAARGGPVELLSLRLHRPDGAIHESKLIGLFDLAKNEFVPLRSVAGVFEDQPNGTYVLEVTTTLALPSAAYELYAEWK